MKPRSIAIPALILTTLFVLIAGCGDKIVVFDQQQTDGGDCTIERGGGNVWVNCTFGSLYISPESATNRVLEFTQGQQICNNYTSDLWAFAGYAFNDTLNSKDAFIEKNVSYQEPTYGPVEQNYTCKYNATWTGPPVNISKCYFYNATNQTNVTVFEHYCKRIHAPSKTCFWDETGQNGSITKYKMQKVNVNDHFSVHNKSGMVIYHNTDGSKLKPGQCVNWSIIYGPKYVSGKWTGIFYLHTSDDWTCILDDSCAYSGWIDPMWYQILYLIMATPNMTGSAVNNSEAIVFFKISNCTDGTGYPIWNSSANNASCRYNLCSNEMGCAEDCSDVEFYNADTNQTLSWVAIPNATGVSYYINSTSDGLFWDAARLINFSMNGTNSTNIRASCNGTNTTSKTNDANPDLIDLWAFEPSLIASGQLLDWSGNGRTLSVTGSPIFTQNSGCIKGNGQTSLGCYNFTASGQKLTASAPSAVTNLSMAAWIYPLGNGGWTTGGYNAVILGGLGDGAGGDAMMIFRGSSVRNLFFFLQNGAGDFSACSQQNLVLNNSQWYHVVMTMDGTSGTAKTYLNGALINTTTNASCIRTWKPPYIIDVWALRANDWYQGIIDDVKIYNRTLSAAEVNASYYKPKHDGPKRWNSSTIDTPPNSTFISQNPSDLTSTNAFTTGLNISYNITDTSGVNESTVKLWFKFNSTGDACSIYTNGTCTMNNTWTSQTGSNQSDTWNFSLHDNQIYPATYNIDEESMEHTTHTSATLTSPNQYLEIRLQNVSTPQYAFFEIMANKTSGASGPLRIYYCNSTYTTGNPAASSNCAQFCTIAAGQAYNHSHPDYSWHHVCPITLDTTVGGVVPTSTSYFLLRGAASTTWSYWYITNQTNSFWTTTTAGSSWGMGSGTIDSHLHQYKGSTTLFYMIEACDVLGNCGNGTVSGDAINESSLPPTAPNIVIPVADGSYYCSMNITWAASTSPKATAIDHYNISLLNEDFSFNQTINSSTNLTWNLWTIPSTMTGDKKIRVVAYDDDGVQSSPGISSNFTINDDTGLAFSLPTIMIVGSGSIDASAYLSGNRSAGTFSIYSENTSQVDCGTSGSSITYNPATGFNGWATCGVSYLTCLSNNYTSTLGMDVYAWSIIDNHTEGGSIFINTTSWTNKSASIRCRAYDGTNYSSYFTI